MKNLKGPQFGPENDNPLFRSVFGGRLTKGDKKKIEIVESAVDLFGQMGVDRVTVEDIAKQLKTSRSHVNYHYKEMDSLIEAAIQLMMSQGIQHTLEQMHSAIAGKDQFKKYIHGYLGFFGSHQRFIPLMMYFFYVSSFKPRFKELQTQVRSGAFLRIREMVIQLYIEAGKRIPKNVESIVGQIQARILTGLIYCLTTGDGKISDQLDLAKEQVFKDSLAIARLK